MVHTQTTSWLGNAAPSRGGWSAVCEARLTSLADMDWVIEAILGEMGTHGYGESDVYGMRLSLEEAITNGLKHGNKQDPAKGVEVTWEVDGQHVLATIEDEGAGFDPAHLADPLSADGVVCRSGRGVLLMQHYLTWLRYNERGNQVTLCKYRSVS